MSYSPAGKDDLVVRMHGSGPFQITALPPEAVSHGCTSSQLAGRSHRFRFDAVVVMPYAAMNVWNAGEVKEPFADGVAPHHRVNSLVLKEIQRLCKALIVNAAPEALPAWGVG